KGLKATRPIMVVVTSSSARPCNSTRPISLRLLFAQSTMNGVTSSLPPTSPSHQVSQIPGNFAGSAKPASTKLPTPMVALIIVPGTRVRQVNKITWGGSSNRCVDVFNRFSNVAVISDSSVLPPAIKKEVDSDRKVVALAKNAPAAIAGHIPFPHKRRLASANPLGGHTGLALG